ncbi:KTSC domain-containing protein [Nitrosospira sp. Nsp11]|uniref:KTSC domain-containing protein n=1 Tax=Nitrosospira sp. Nsp11 TaxID=1855338 RepID=UPI0009182A63|nr:KTSC domain-containing protein [Nitrosospira sp. Nsp11]SHL41810.1 KTSC domain-containing protein [Nitrosospira sp. Nsp11]
MDRVFVSSTSIRAVGYDPKTRKLEIEFINGGIYRFSGVPDTIHARLMASHSKGQYFAAHIKDVYLPLRIR